MDTDEISGVPSDVPSESTLESEIDALSKIITDTKDDVHKFDDNDGDFKLDSNDISFTDSLQEQSAESNKSVLLPDDVVPINDILDGSKDLESFISTADVGSDSQEVLEETFETAKDSSCSQNSPSRAIIDQNSDQTTLPAESLCVNNATLMDTNTNAQMPTSNVENEPLLDNQVTECLTGTELQIDQQSIEQIDPSAGDSQVDSGLANFCFLDDLPGSFDKKSDVAEQSELNTFETKTSENIRIDTPDFIKALNPPFLNPPKSTNIFMSRDISKELSKGLEELEEDSSDEEQNHSGDDTDPDTKNNDTSTVQKNDEKICESEEIDEADVSEPSQNFLSEDFTPDILVSNGNNDNNLKIDNEPKIIDEMPTTDPLETAINIENSELICQSSKTDEETTTSQILNDEKEENNVIIKSEEDKLIDACEISQKSTTSDNELERIDSKDLENLSDMEKKFETTEDLKDVEIVEGVCKAVDNKESATINPNLSQEKESSSVINEETSDINLGIEVVNTSQVESEIVHIDVIKKQDEKPSESSEDQVDIKSLSKPEESSSLSSQDLPADIVTLHDSLDENIEHAKSTEKKELSGADRTSCMNQEISEVNTNQQDLDSQGLISNILNEVETDLNSDLNKLLETKENINDNISNFDNSEILNSPDENLKSLDEKSLDPLSSLDAISDQIDNEKLTSTEKEEDITFEESSQSPTPMQNDKFLNDLYNNCMPDDTTQNSNTEIETVKEKSNFASNDDKLSKGDIEQGLEILKSSLETEDQQLMETDALESATDFIFEETQTEKSIDEPLAVISELESAVKFLQESEEQGTSSSQTVSTNEENTSLFVAVEENECDNASELASELPEMTLDPIAISEAEIISEAAKLENERKEKLELEKLKNSKDEVSELQDVDETEPSALSSTENVSSDIEPTDASNEEPETSSQDKLQVPSSSDTSTTSESPPKKEVFDEQHEEPPKIEISEESMLIESSKTALLVQKSRLDSPDRQTTSAEPKICDTPTKKDCSDKQQQSQVTECENVGSPRIILKIAKSAIAECSEPRSPKSPKVRSSDSPNPDDSPSSHKLGKIKLKLSKGGHPSIIPSGDSHQEDTWHTDCTASSLSPMSMKIKITKSNEASEELQKQEEAKDKVEETKKQESPIGMKFKLSKTGDASIVQQDNKDTTQETTAGKKQDSPSLGMKIKLSKSGDASIIQQDKSEHAEEISLKAKDKHVEDEGMRRTESPIGMKIKLSKSGDASVISNDPLESTKETINEPIKRTDSPIGVKIKLPKNKGGTPSIIPTETSDEVVESSTAKTGIGMKIKLSKTGDASVIHPTKEDSHEATEQHFGMKIKFSKTGDPSIIQSQFSREYEDIAHKSKHSKHRDHGAIGQRSKDDSHLEMKIKLSKTGHPTIVAPTESALDSFKTSSTSPTKSQADIMSFKRSHADVTIEPIKSQPMENTMMDLHSKRKEISIAPIESKKQKIDPSTKQTLPDITIQPITPTKEQQQLVLESNTGSISRQQMNVINQEISITQVCSLTPGDSLMGEHLKNTLNVPTGTSTPSSSDCEIIEAQPELIIVNENSNSSQDVMIIDEVPPVKAPKKRGRPRRSALPAATTFQSLEPSIDPLSFEQPGMHMQHAKVPLQMQPIMLQQVPPQHIVPPAGDGTERPRRTCRSQKSYAPPKRGRGRGRGKRKNEALDIPSKKPRMEEEFVGMEHTNKPVIALQKLGLDSSSTLKNSPELFRALNQPTLNQMSQQPRNLELLQASEQAKALSECEVIEIAKQGTTTHRVQEGGMEVIKIPSHGQVPGMHLSSDVQMAQAPVPERGTHDKNSIVIKVSGEQDGKPSEMITEQAEPIQQNQSWLAPSIRKVSSETISTLTVMDEETRMSAESGSRSQTPARNMSAPGALDTLVNEESQNSVLSTATTESERVKQPKTRRMEITLDPDEGPFTVDKIAEYEWPAADKSSEPKPAGSRGETYMIQEQISHYLGVKSFKRKYPDLKRRMVDMEERNFLRENGLVSEAMCDLGLTAVSSSEVLDIMCSDFPEQYEEYRKHMREKAAKEHSKKQKELSAAANAERNRIDLAEMAMQSALTWNSGFNKARQESRKCSLDLQTFTVHQPRRQPKYDPSRRGCNYPCALISGQYTDYFREYKPAELRYYPINTVIYGPTKPNERKFDSQSECSQSDSDSDSSSDDSSSTTSEGTQDTEGSQSTMDEVDMELALDPSIKCKMCSNHLNKNNRPETLIVCGTCNGNVHPSCIDLTLDMVPHIRAYAWQCTDCKTCAQCHDPADEDKMLFCDMCDRGYHIYCVGLRRVPQGRWHCQECAVCANCGSKEPGGANSDRNSVAQWQHEFKKGDKNTRVYVSTFCVPCSKLWRKGRYCPHCSRCHNAPRLDQEPNLVHCGECDKYLHLECVETKGVTIDKRNYLCEFCSPNRQHLVKPLTSKTFKT